MQGADPPEPHGPYWQWTANINGRRYRRPATTSTTRSTPVVIGRCALTAASADRSSDSGACRACPEEPHPNDMAAWNAGACCPTCRTSHCASRASSSNPRSGIERHVGRGRSRRGGTSRRGWLPAIVCGAMVARNQVRAGHGRGNGPGLMVIVTPRVGGICWAAGVAGVVAVRDAAPRVRSLPGVGQGRQRGGDVPPAPPNDLPLVLPGQDRVVCCGQGTKTSFPRACPA